MAEAATKRAFRHPEDRKLEVRMEYTEGLGREAQVWVNGELLTVCDGISLLDSPVRPGELDSVKFSYMSAEGFSWDQAICGNRGERKMLQHVRGPAYVGYGKVVAIMPVVIDFGLLQMADPNWTTDEYLVGRYVKIHIDRLEISPDHQPDWPDDA